MASILSKENWIEILQNKEITNELNLSIFTTLYSFDKHQAPASKIAQILDTKHNSLNLEIGRYAKRIAKFYDINFKIRENQKEKFWDLFFNGWEDGQLFIWELKNEIKEALEALSMIKHNIKTKNILLYGAPGVGKTHNYKRLVTMIENGEDEKSIFDAIASNETTANFDSSLFETIKNEKRIEFVTFHQSYSYEDFIEGFRPQENGKIELEDGIFKMIADRALKNSSKNHYIIIDEINRGNISKIFGELITLIEEDKRDGYEVTLPYSKEKFKIPSNLYIIATMNSTDKSIATMDIALRRRFTFVKMQPNLDLVEDQKARALMKNLNEYIKAKIGEEYQLGHSYFMGKDIDLDFVEKYKIKPLLEEYFYGEDIDIDSVIQTAKRDFDASHS
ncbi:MAG: AAA family ATPase [Campylobacterales bacterium]|nr:AAA family ATPase [Campylobacterales bacterium]